MTRSEFLAEVAKAEKRARKRRRPRVMAEASLDALARGARGRPAARRPCGPPGAQVRQGQDNTCKSPRVCGGTRCWHHGGLKQNPSHPGNARRLSGGVFAAQAAYRIELKTMGEYWNRLTVEYLARTPKPGKPSSQAKYSFASGSSSSVRFSVSFMAVSRGSSPRRGTTKTETLGTPRNECGTDL